MGASSGPARGHVVGITYPVWEGETVAAALGLHLPEHRFTGEHRVRVLKAMERAAREMSERVRGQAPGLSRKARQRRAQCRGGTPHSKRRRSHLMNAQELKRCAREKRRGSGGHRAHRALREPCAPSAARSRSSRNAVGHRAGPAHSARRPARRGEGTNFNSTYGMFGFRWLEDNFLSRTTYDVTCHIESHGFEAVPLFGYAPDGMPVGHRSPRQARAECHRGPRLRRASRRPGRDRPGRILPHA